MGGGGLDWCEFVGEPHTDQSMPLVLTERCKLQPINKIKKKKLGTPSYSLRKKYCNRCMKSLKMMGGEASM